MRGSESVRTMVTNSLQLNKIMSTNKAAITLRKCRTVAFRIIARIAFPIHLTRAFLFRHWNAFIHYTSYPHK